ncbi:aldo/keto reductase [Aeromicrobium wangtongii]|uniref:aldo/keto reductase n=1 Tax=Aeromicrobium wangtongii TaxID=2969247 RepID=UPI002016E797|nr:aldo/keto reductase [Aeromicrobium wangtongii]MCL3817207.1 aldo/keto reductase [Aeromicrobium wangtongii]
MTGLDFGPLVLGGNTFGWTSSAQESHAVLDAFVDAGGRSIDTADVYSMWVPGNTGGDSERIIGDWLAARGRRDDVVIATKVYSLPDRPGLSPENVRAAVDDSLSRLRTDHIDLYYAHRDDQDVPQAEYVGVFDELVQAGKIREAGASNFSAERLKSAVTIAADAGQTGFTVAQDHFNLVERDYAEVLAPTVAELGLVELPYSSLAAGFLTGKYRPGTTVDSARSGGAGSYLQDERNVALLDVLDEVAAAHGVSVTAVSLAWLRQQATVAAPIASARTVEQVAALVESFDLVLTDEELARLT